jgi:hypothetical protein
LPIWDPPPTGPSDEAVEADVIDERTPQIVRLRHSPGAAQGFAAGDTIDISTRPPTLLRRGGNLCVQLWLDDARELDLAIDELLPGVEALGGRVDGGSNHMRVLTIPATAGFAQVEALMTSAATRRARIEWMFGNVYDPTSGEPLGWWDAKH